MIGGPSRERGSAFGRLVAALRLAAVAASIVGVGCARTDKESRDKERHAAVRAALAERWANVRYDSESIAAIDDPDVARALDGDLAYWLTRRRTDAVVGEKLQDVTGRFLDCGVFLHPGVALSEFFGDHTHAPLYSGPSFGQQHAAGFGPVLIAP